MKKILSTRVLVKIGVLTTILLVLIICTVWGNSALMVKRIYARYYLGMAVNEIAEVEGVDPSRVRESIRRGLKQLVKYF